MEAWRHLPATKEAFRRLDADIDELMMQIRTQGTVNPNNADATQFHTAFILGKIEGYQEALNTGRE